MYSKFYLTNQYLVKNDTGTSASERELKIGHQCINWLYFQPN